MPNNGKWQENNIPEQTGKIVIVTGANSGIGYETTRALAEKNATVIMACRNLEKGNQALAEIKKAVPSSDVVVMKLDLGDLDSVHQFADEFLSNYDRLDMLINNAGIMIPPYGKTKQGFETQFGVNHLGHFALTGLLFERIKSTPNSRIVTVSSGAHNFGEINFDDLNWEERSYQPNRAYGQSKLANLLFTYELQRKLTAVSEDTLAVAAHPGWTQTNLQAHNNAVGFLTRFIGQPQTMGALPTLYAAIADDVSGGEYFGPKGLWEMRGYPKKVDSNKRSHDEQVAQRLWEVSEELTGVKYNFN